MNHCPSCGYNLSADTALEIGPWRIEPRLGVLYGDRLVTRNQTHVGIILTVARANGRTVSSEVLLNRVSDSSTTNTIAVQMCRLRERLRSLGIPCPVESVRARPGGYRWTG